MKKITTKADAEEIEISIQLLNTYVDDASIKPVLQVLEELKLTPDNTSLIQKLADTLNTIGVTQGAVLTYAPYISVLISNGLFGDE